MSIFIGFGSNIGDKIKNCKNALTLIDNLPSTKIIKCSKFYKTKPYGEINQDYFINGVCEIKTKLHPIKLLLFLLNIEGRLKRERKKKWGPRTIDLDIIFYQDKVINLPYLFIPHPDMHKRGFVLVPLAEIAPDFVHPIFKKTISELLEDLKKKRDLGIL